MGAVFAGVAVAVAAAFAERAVVLAVLESVFFSDGCFRISEYFTALFTFTEGAPLQPIVYGELPQQFAQYAVISSLIVF